MSIIPIYFNIIGDIVQQFTYCTINGSINTYHSILGNIYGTLIIPDLVITDLENFISNSFALSNMDIVNTVSGNVNGTTYDFKIYPTFTNIDTYTTDNNISLSSSTKNTVIIFSQIQNPVQFAGLVSGYETITSFYLKVYDIINDEIHIPFEQKNITIRLSKTEFNIPTSSIAIYKYIDGSNVPVKYTAKLINNDYFEFIITSGSTFIITPIWKWLINMDLDFTIQLNYLPLLQAPDTFYHVSTQANFYSLFSNYYYKQVEQGDGAPNNFLINLSYDNIRLDNILGSNIISPGQISSLGHGSINPQATGTQNGSIIGADQESNNIGLRFLEIVAIHIFGHAKARSAIKNDRAFDNINIDILNGMHNSLTEETKQRYFKEFVGTGKLVPWQNYDDITKWTPFNFDQSSIRYTINFHVGGIYDSLGVLTNIVQDNSDWNTNITIDFIHNTSLQ
jgi:hypothetical protein